MRFLTDTLCFTHPASWLSDVLNYLPQAHWMVEIREKKLLRSPFPGPLGFGFLRRSTTYIYGPTPACKTIDH